MRRHCLRLALANYLRVVIPNVRGHLMSTATRREAIGTMVTIPSWEPQRVRVIDIAQFPNGSIKSVCVKLNGHIQWISPEGLIF
jgi:hypothetical protein